MLSWNYSSSQPLCHYFDTVYHKKDTETPSFLFTVLLSLFFLSPSNLNCLITIQAQQAATPSLFMSDRKWLKLNNFGFVSELAPFAYLNGLTANQPIFKSRNTERWNSLSNSIFFTFQNLCLHLLFSNLMERNTKCQ